jgi:SAM-dependent methyltransferase
MRVRWGLRHGAIDDFDRVYGVQTRIVPSWREFFRTFRRGGVEHEPSPPAGVREILDGLDIPFQETVFVDVGSGAGRVVLLAAEYPFKRVVGVELTPSLHARAEANVKALPSEACRAGAVQLECGDATAYALPDDPLVLYFYNPFGVAAMTRVMKNIETSLLRVPRRITLVLMYCYKEPREVVRRSQFFRVVRDGGGVLVLRSLTATARQMAASSAHRLRPLRGMSCRRTSGDVNPMGPSVGS